MPTPVPQVPLHQASTSSSTLTPSPRPCAVPQDRLGASPIIYGTSCFAQLYNPIKAHWPAEACRRAIDLGINTFDTSPYYGNSEHVLGKALASIASTHPRETYYLSTKVGRYGPKKVEFDYSKERVRESVEESMRRMHTDYLDIVYAHDVEFVSVDSAVEAVGELFRLKVCTLSLRPIFFFFVVVVWDYFAHWNGCRIMLHQINPFSNAQLFGLVRMQDAVENGDLSSPFLFLVCHSLSFQTISLTSHSTKLPLFHTHFTNSSLDNDMMNNRQRARSSMSASAVRISLYYPLFCETVCAHSLL